MHDILFEYYFACFEVLIILIFVGGIGGVICWGLRRRWKNTIKALEQKASKYDPEAIRALHDHLQSIVAHEFIHGLDYIEAKGAEVLDGLSEEQDILRSKQNKIIEKAHELTQHATNVLDVFATEPGEPKKELLNIRRLVEHVLLEFFPYAESRGVTIRQKLDDIEPAALNKDLVLQTIKNVIHNAIKYSYPGGVVEVSLYIEKDERADADGMICTEVKDTGKGIAEEDQDRIFELKKRGDGLIEPGSGLGLYCAREAARRQSGDVILVSSGLNKGSIFQIVLPYCGV
jgi:signal transduction histidine kinase